MAQKAADGLWRRQFLGGAGGLALGGLGVTGLPAQPTANRVADAGDLALVNGKIHTMARGGVAPCGSGRMVPVPVACD